MVEVVVDNIEAVQGTDEWRQARCGKATASRISDVIARIKTGWGASRDNYIADLVVERLTGRPVEGYKSAAMIRGTEMEEEARLAFEVMTGWEVQAVGFVQHPTLEWSGASPDGLLPGNSLVQFKAPEPKTHIEYLLGAPIGRNYLCQLQWEMDVTGCDAGYWCSYNPLFPPEMRLVIKRFGRGGEVLDELRREVPIFLTEVEMKLAVLQKMYAHEPVSLRSTLEASLVSP